MAGGAAPVAAAGTAGPCRRLLGHCARQSPVPFKAWPWHDTARFMRIDRRNRMLGHLLAQQRRCHKQDVRWASQASQEPKQTQQAFSSVISRLSGFVNSNVTSCVLVTALLLGWHFPGLGFRAGGMNLSPLSTSGMFFLSGLQLQTGEVRAALRCPVAMVYGLGSVLCLTTLFAPAALALPLVPRELAIGLAVFCCMPTTLSTGVVLTQAVRGNAAVALLLTVCSNLLSVLSVPLALRTVLGPGAAGAAAGFSPAAIARSLAITVLAPLLAGVGVQLLVPGVPSWRAGARRQLSWVSAGLLAFIPWMQISRASACKLPLSGGMLSSIAAAALCLHLVFLTLNSLLTRFIRFDPGDASADRGIRRAVVLCTSQKTLPIAVAAISHLNLGPGSVYAALACVAAHLLQTLFDSSLVSWWLRSDARRLTAAELGVSKL